jgi:hypothetical protein
MKLSIKNFQAGQTSSPYTTNGAFWKSANLDIHGQEGLARINYKPTGTSGSSPNHVQGIITGFAGLLGTGGNVIFADNGKPVKRWTGGTSIANIGSSALNAYYVKVWKGYVLATTATGIQAMATSAGMDGAWSSALTADSGSIQNITLHKMLVSNGDGKVYIANKNYVAVLSETSGDTFDPADVASYDLIADALLLPTDYKVESLEDFGRFIAVFVSLESQARTLVLLWDRTSTTGLDAVFEIREQKMTSTIEHHGEIYITGGHQGNIYKLSESGLRKYAQIKVDDYDNQKLIYSGGLTSYTNIAFTTMAMWKDKLMVAVSTSGLTSAGIYSVKDGRVNHEFIISNGTDTDNNQLGSILTWGDYLLYGYRTLDPATYVFDIIRDDNNRLQTGAYFETPLLRAGYTLQKGFIDRIEVILARPLQTGESFTVKYRRNINDTYTTLDTKSYATDGAQSSYVLGGIKSIQNIQLKVELGTGATSKNTPLIQEITLF